MKAAEKAYGYISVGQNIPKPASQINSYRYCVENILGEEYPLEFNQEEVDELLEVLQSCLYGFPGDGEVFARAEGTDKTLGENQLASNLDHNGN